MPDIASFKIHPHLWFADKAEEAARFYASIFPDSSVDDVTVMPTDTPSGPVGAVTVVEFTLAGQPFMAMSAGPLDDFNHAISLMVMCEDQAEIDRYYDPLAKGGQIEPCGWLKDRYGVSWQITPRVLNEMMKAPDKAAAKRALDAMLKMKKLDVAALQRAFDGPAKGKSSGSKSSGLGR